MKRFGMVLFFGIALCGCSASRYTRLDKFKPPEALVIPKKVLSEVERRSLFEAHRGFVNDLGVQIGRRHFDVQLLPDYFRRSELEPFARHAESLEWGRRAIAKAGDLQGGYKWPITKGMTRVLKNGVGFDQGGLFLVFAAGVVVDLVGRTAYEGWRVVAQAELDALSRKAAEFSGTPEDLIFNYNRWLALSLGVSPTAAALSPLKSFPPPWPVRATLGVNAEKVDWCEDYHLEKYRGNWYFGGQKVDGYYALNIYGENFNAETRKNNLKAVNERDILEYNRGYCANLFPEQVKRTTKDIQ